MSTPRLSVVLCTYNRADLLREVLQQLERQTFPKGRFPWELVLVDNNSTDHTAELARGWAAEGRLPMRYLHEPRQGKAFALNTGVEQAASDALVFTDDDVVLDGGWLAAVHDAFDEHEHACFGGRVLPILDQPLPDWLTDDPRYAVHGGPLVRHDRGDEPREYDASMYPPTGANMFMRRDVFERHGSFNEALGYHRGETLISGEDTELMFRFIRRGEPILYYPRALVHHPVVAERLRKPYFKRWFWGAGRGRARWLDLPEGTVRYFNVPRYMIRQAGQEFLRLLLARLGGKPYKVFHHEVQLLYRLGTIYELYVNGE